MNDLKNNENQEGGHKSDEHMFSKFTVYFKDLKELKGTLANHLQALFSLIIMRLESYSPLQQGFFYAIMTLVSIKIIQVILNFSSFLFVFYGLIHLFMTTFALIALYACFNLVFRNSQLNDKRTLFLFITCFISEFFIQFTSYNLSINQTTTTTTTTNSDFVEYQLRRVNAPTTQLLVESINHVIIIASVFTLASIYLNLKLREKFLSILVVCLTRFYGTIYLSNVIPAAICSYYTYVCALIGILISNNLQEVLNLSGPCIKQKLIDFDAMISLFDKNSGKRLLSSSNSTASFHIRHKSSNNSNNSNHFTQLNNQRRTSLPTIPAKMEKSSPDCYKIITQVQNILDDVFTLQEINMNNLINGYKKIQKLIENSDYDLTNSLHSSKNSNFESLNSYSADEDEENKNSKKHSNEISHSFKPVKCRNRKSLPTQIYKRISTWSTTTSATGLPIIELLPARHRSLNLKANFFNQNEKLKDDVDNQKSDSYLSVQEEICTENLEKENNEETKILLDNLAKRKSYDDYGEKINNCKNTCKTSDYDSAESPNNSDYNSDTDKLNITEQQNAVFGEVKQPKSYHQLISLKKMSEIKSLKEDDEKPNNKSFDNSESIMISSKDNNDSNSKIWNVEDLESIDLLNYLHDWNFPIFQLNEKSNENVLSQMAYKIFDEIGLFKSFDIPINAFIEYFTALERGYIDLPYHNKIHAADVLHASYYLTTQAIPGFISKKNSLGNQRERSSLNVHQYSLKFCMNNETYGCLGANFDPLELLALYCSAAMHDYEHPGRNNQFLVSINSPLALLYNDRSVLENHHASASWLLLKTNQKYNFLANLEPAEWKRFRFLVLENILATDLSRHYSLIAEFNDRIKFKNSVCMSNLGKSFATCSGKINWDNETDRLLVSQIVLKLADINAPLKEKDLHVQWTSRIVEEFYMQGEEELSRGMKISPYMDRANPKVPELQETFIRGLVGSLCHSYIAAGLLPGILIEDLDTSDELNEAELETGKSSRIHKLSNDFQLYSHHSNKKHKIFYSELTSNFKSNYEMWCERLKQEQKMSNSSSACSTTSSS